MGEDGSDPRAVVRAAEWEAPLRIEAERLDLAALGELPLIEVEAEGLSLSLVRAAEDVARSAAPVETPAPAQSESGPGRCALLAEVAVATAGLAVPVPRAQAASCWPPSTVRAWMPRRCWRCSHTSPSRLTRLTWWPPPWRGTRPRDPEAGRRTAAQTRRVADPQRHGWSSLTFENVPR